MKKKKQGVEEFKSINDLKNVFFPKDKEEKKVEDSSDLGVKLSYDSIEKIKARIASI